MSWGSSGKGDTGEPVAWGVGLGIAGDRLAAICSAESILWGTKGVRASFVQRSAWSPCYA